MRIPTDAEVEDIFSPRTTSNFKVKRRDTQEGYVLEVSQMYGYVPCGIDQILGLCKLFETEDVSVAGQEHSDGCETCDYGSSYSVEFLIKDKPLSVEMVAWINSRMREKGDIIL